MQIKNALDLSSTIRFGAEIEINPFDLESSSISAIPYSQQNLPLGIYDVAFLVGSIVKDRVFVTKWGNNHNNNYWVVKPDSSCGMEICPPVLKGWLGIQKITEVIECLSLDKRIKSDKRCSFHVHFDVSSLKEEDLLSIISWWIKAEAVFMDSVPSYRKINQYCQLIAQSGVVNSVAEELNLSYFLEKLGVSKYYSLNTFHYYNKKRKTIEFRIMDNESCLDSIDAKNWIALMLHFLETAITRGLPQKFSPKDPFSGYCWLDPIDLFCFLGFLPDQFQLSPRLLEVRDWFVLRLLKNGKNNTCKGLFCADARKQSCKEIEKLSRIIQAI
jgi:hypothetical protein